MHPFVIEGWRKILVDPLVNDNLYELKKVLV